MTIWLLRRSQFLLERWVQRGVLPQLLLMTSIIAAVAVGGGLVAWSTTSAFERPSTAIWWSFLRLTDPGYLGDDEGTVLRLVSTVVTVLGYVLFMGSLVAIMTQWLARTIRRLENGLSPIAMENHFVILGWTNRTPEILKKLLTAEGRVERLMARRGVGNKLRIVVVAEEVSAGMRLELRESLGKDWSESQIFLRSGSSLHPEHLARLDLPHAAVVMIPGADFALGGAELTDARVVKTLLTLDSLFRRNPNPDGRVPHVVAEVFDPRKVLIARSSFRGAEIIASDRLVCGVLSQSLQHVGTGEVLLDLLSHRDGGNTVFLRSCPELVGARIRALGPAFPQAVVLGAVLVRDGVRTVRLDPRDTTKLEEDDLLVFVAKRYDDCVPDLEARLSDPATPGAGLAALPKERRRRLLILGWSNKVPTLLAELLGSDVDRFEVTILSLEDMDRRTRILDGLKLTEQMPIQNVLGDYSLENELSVVQPHTYDHILFVAGVWMESSEEADARTILGLLLLNSLLEAHPSPPRILVELLDPDNARILERAAEVVFVSPRMLSHLLAQVGLRPELNAVFDELISSKGASIDLRKPQDLGLHSSELTFAQLQGAAADAGCIGLGFYFAAGGTAEMQLHLNPERERRWTLRESDRIVILQS